MALTNIPGFTGYQAKRISSLDQRAIGKFTDTNALYSMHKMAPSEYDRKIITLYTQTALYSNDFLQMINQSTPYMPDNEYFSWKIGVPYRFPTIIEIPISTSTQLTPGIDGLDFEIVLDRKAFFIHNTITSDNRYGPQFYITDDPTPYNKGWKYKCTLVTQSPLTDYVDSSWLQVGLNMQLVGAMIGEFDQELPGLPDQAQDITLYDTVSSGIGAQHKISKWATQLGQKDSKGQPLDMMVFAATRLNEMGKAEVIGTSWQSYIEVLIRKYMLDMKVHSFIWSKPGTSKSQRDRQEVKKSIEGLYWKMRNHGNYITYNRGQFNLNLMRSVFGDLFYRRVDIAERKVKVYTNEAGMEVFNTSLKKDALGNGLVFNVGDNDKFVSGSGQNLKLNFNFSSVWTLDTGTIELVHLKELDQPQTNTEFGQNKKSTPIYIVFDISPEGDGTPKNNVREVRLAGNPSMTWGFINGRTPWNGGHAASQGMISSSMDPATQIWMEDRCDIFVEDLSRMVLIEEKPQY